MDQETSLKHSKLKKRLKLALAKSVSSSGDKVKTLDSKKKGIVGKSERIKSRRVKTDDYASDVEDDSGGSYRGKKSSRDENGGGYRGKRSSSDENGGGYRGKRSSSDENGGGYRGKRSSSDENGGGYRGKRSSSDENGGGYRGKRSYSDENGGGYRGKKSYSDENGGGYRGKRSYSDENGGGYRGKRSYSDEKGSGYRGKRSYSDEKDGGYRGKRSYSDEKDSGYRGKRSYSDEKDGCYRGKRSYGDENDSGYRRQRINGGVSSGRGLKSNYRDKKVGKINVNESNGFAKKRIYANDVKSKVNNNNASISKNKTSNKRELHDAVGDRTESENDEDMNGDVKYVNTKQLRNSAEEHKFGMKYVSRDSLATFDRPKRKMRLIRINYPNDPSNKRFDDSPPKIDNTKEQKKDPDTEEKAEMSQNAKFRAIKPSPCIATFVNENLLGRRRDTELRRAGYNIELRYPLDNVPFSKSSERERIEDSVFRNKLEFFAAAKVSSSFPPLSLPEIAFAGRSNVGKSSLLNSLTRQWGVARTSDKPGLTQTINFFKLGSKLCLVDLPGYGFAYAKEEVKESWQELVKEYVSTREGLKRVCLLIDTKWGMKPTDNELVHLMERSKTKYQIVLTKTDLSLPVDVARRAMQIEESLKPMKFALQPLMMVSSRTGAGIRSFRTLLSNVARFAKL